ncbi:MAG TPA: excinuclease ABC subunit UvrA [Pirellulales bacterium]|nr:excinuclease ABC subunit UvrA [Pirellulales bacterium]
MSVEPATNPVPAESAPAGNGVAPPDMIRVRGARVHNLRNIDIDIPRDQLVTITGPSGSGKSSLAFDTLFAEGQRQYIESLSAHARQFVHQLERPDVDLIEGLQPTISIDQRAGSQNPRSTVATVTEIYDHLRLLVARLGTPHCYQCGAAIRQQSPEEILEELLQLPAGTKAMLLAPIVRGRKGQHREVFATIRKAGFIRARVDGELADVDNPPELNARKSHQIEAVIDRIVIREGINDRLAESIQMGVSQGEGTLLVSYFERASDESSEGVWHDLLFSTLYACPNCKISYEELEPRTFSFNSPYGACPTCEGLGTRIEFDPDLILPDMNLSLSERAIAPWKNDTDSAERQHKKLLAPFLDSHSVRWNTPLVQWKPAAMQQFLRGDGNDFLGLLILLEKEFATATRTATRERLESFRGEVVCPACHGARLRPEARSVRFGGRAIHEIAALSVDRAAEFFAGVEVHPDDLAIYEPIAGEIRNRLAFLSKVGLDYITLNRPADTLSGGELQRVRLTTGIGSGLVGVCYVLDEPSIGLHPRDNQRLIEAIRQLQQQGNTVLVVEHDQEMMRQADRLIDMGPGAGLHGGRIVSQGTPSEVAADPNSLTGKYLSGKLRIPLPDARRRVAKTRSITIENVTTNNLKDAAAMFPLGVFVCVTGVSGSGKSSLLNETLARAITRRLTGMGPKPGPHGSLRGVNQIDKLVEIDQSPIGRTPRSNPATYTGVFDEIRRVFVETREAKQRGYRSGRFSFNTKGGRCEECQGQGVRKLEMNFLPDLYVACPVCEGKRFNRQTLEILYRGRSIADVLEMRIEEASGFFENFPVIHRLLKSLEEVGLGYLQLGQPSTTLSGGEAQRIKLATELGRVDTGKTLYLLDEPTTGLHFDDIKRLLQVLQRLVDRGNTVIVIEHNLDVIKTADWIIDLGPEGGDSGGQIVATGTPEQIAALNDNHTGRHLRPLLNGHPASALNSLEPN